MPRLRPLVDPKSDPNKIDPAVDPKLATPKDEPEVEAESEVEVGVEQEEDAAVLLQQQIDALKKSEQAQRERADQFEREREEALRQAREREGQVSHFRKESQQSQFDAVSTALAAAMSEAESAKRDIKTAVAEGNVDAQADAYERLAAARANISKLEDGKVELEARLKAPPEQEQQTGGDHLDRTNLPESAKTWLRKHPEYMTDTRKNAKIQSLHWDVIDEGHSAFSTAYFESLETKLGLREAPEIDDDDPKPRTEQRKSIVSAPVSREAPSTPNQPRGGTIKLSPDEREAAKIAGVSEAEYAKQKQKLSSMKANGTYGERQ